MNYMLGVWGCVADVPSYSQAALCEAAFDVLRSRFGAKYECFASPLNCRSLCHSASIGVQFCNTLSLLLHADGRHSAPYTLTPTLHLEAWGVFSILKQARDATRYGPFISRLQLSHEFEPSILGQSSFYI